MCIEDIVRMTAGIFIIASLALGYFYSWYFLFFTAFVGLNLLQSAFTHFCPLEIILKKSGFKYCRK